MTGLLLAVLVMSLLAFGGNRMPELLRAAGEEVAKALGVPKGPTGYA